MRSPSSTKRSGSLGELVELRVVELRDVAASGRSCCRAARGSRASPRCRCRPRARARRRRRPTRSREGSPRRAARLRCSSSTFETRVFREPSLNLEHADQLGPLAARLVHRLEHRGRAERLARSALQALESRAAWGCATSRREDLAIELDRRGPRRRGASRRARRSGTGSEIDSFASSQSSASCVSTLRSSCQFSAL